MNLEPIAGLLAAEEKRHLLTLADDLPESQAREALELLELEEVAGNAMFNLSDQERAAARLLRHDIACAASLRATTAAIEQSRQNLDAMSTPKPKRANFSESVPTNFIAINYPAA